MTLYINVFCDSPKNRVLCDNIAKWCVMRQSHKIMYYVTIHILMYCVTVPKVVFYMAVWECYKTCIMWHSQKFIYYVTVSLGHVLCDSFSCALTDYCYRPWT